MFCLTSLKWKAQKRRYGEEPCENKLTSDSCHCSCVHILCYDKTMVFSGVNIRNASVNTRKTLLRKIELAYKKNKMKLINTIASIKETDTRYLNELTHKETLRRETELQYNDKLVTGKIKSGK